MELQAQMAEYLRVSMQAYWEDNSPMQMKAMLEKEPMSKMIAEELQCMQDEPDLYKKRYGWDVQAWDMLNDFDRAYAIFMSN